MQIKNFFKNEEKFYGVFPRDNLNFTLKEKPVGLIINTDTQKEKGEHWVAIYIKDGKGEYFDSFGLPPLHSHFIDFLNKNCKNGWQFNSCTIQHFDSVKCGKFCIAFLKSRFKNISFADFISQFSFNLRKNEELIENLI